MSLVAGTRLGPYEIQSAIGAGGMGEVYKARDTRLDRTVAIKVLPPGLTTDPDPSAGSGSARAMSRADRRARFEREAKTVAGLSHPHICPLFDVGEHEGSLFLVMEHLAGQTLAERLRKGALPLEQALTIGTEIADALSAAHRQGIVHRDLKPGNVMLTKTGAKLLDFGLAKLTGHAGEPASLSSARTQSAPLTGEGVIVGTLQYMAPEQLEGRAADARTDLWALGAILYEMVTGKPAFEGTSTASLTAAILEREPAPIASIQPLTPPLLDRFVRRCLAKSPDDRPDTAHDVASELRALHESSEAARLAEPPSRSWRVGRAARLAAGFMLFAGLGAGLAWVLAPRASPSQAVRFTVNIAPADALRGTHSNERVVSRPSATAIALSPDGRVLVFHALPAGKGVLYTSMEAGLVRGAEGEGAGGAIARRAGAG